MKKHLILPLCLLSIHISLTAQDISSQLSKSFQTFINSPAVRNGIASLHVIDSESNTVVFEKNSHLGLPTASTLKVITSVTALELLGATYSYETTVGYSGSIDPSGILHGNIIIVGSGDPTLGSDRYPDTKADLLLEKWKDAIKKQGIKAIQGQIIADDRLYKGYNIPNGWIWTDMGNYYGAGISALNWKENKAGIKFHPGSIGSPATITDITENLSYLTIINQVSTGDRGSGDNVYGYAGPYSNKIYVRGTYGQDLKKTIEISVPDPAYQLAFDLHNALQQDGILIAEAPATGQLLDESGKDLPKITARLDTHRSPALTEIVHWFNQKSINLYGEALLRSIAYSDGGKISTTAGTRSLQKFWEDRLQLINTELGVIDGSGLSPQNNVTTAAMNKIMQYAIDRPWYSAFVHSLPTINQMTMKSGTIGGTLGYTGYHTAKNGKRYTFSFLVYNYNGTASAMRRQMFTVLDNLK
ncbi:MAG TPA: D-alanyl-D-alanine carboxypeptidase/D-alanyl-D-alanine-endopeptidase [Sphingobacterium sp.]|nr:D-alanyl-D-alanine carboxypeptidase/D-alanyl-D-alanine-endopeptidase [Sphingobacterium sp.]